MGRGHCGAVHSLLLHLLLLPLPVAEERQCWHHQDTGGLAKDVRCLNSYGSQGRHVACEWKQRHNQSLGEGPFYLKFSDFLNLSSSLLCPLSASPEAHGHYSCAAEGDGEFTELDTYKVSLHAADASSGKNTVYPVFEFYKPRLHIQCDAPTGLQSRINASKCLIQWKKSEAYEDLPLQDWHWHLALKIVKEPWQQAENKSFISQESWVEIDGSEFVRGMDYIARIRCKIPDENTNYCSQWSPWSTTTHWTAPPGDGQKLPDPLPLWPLLASLPLCLGALLFLLLALRLLCRMTDKERAHTPTPATFFQPLYTSHNGDFKGWAGLTGKTVCLGSNTEEDTAMPSRSQEGKGHALGVPSSQITFCPVGVKPVALRAECTQGPQSSSGRQGKGSLLLPWGASLWEPGQTQKEKADPPSFLELGPCRETEALFSCSNDYYCMWGDGGGSSSSKPGTLMHVPAGEPQGVKEGGPPGVALAQGPPGQV